MKKQKIFNFALTTMCVAVLSACGSSGGGSLAVENTPTTPSANANANTGADNSAALTAAQKAAQEAAAKQAAAEQEAAAAKAAAEKAEQAAKDAAEKAKEDTAKAVEQALKDKEAADKAAAEAAKAEADAKKAAEEAEKAALAAANKANAFGNKDKLEDTPYTGGEKSFVGIKHVVKVDSNLATNSSQGKDSTSDIPTPMNVQQPHPSLDTIVVAEPLQNESGAPRVYLEDFDTRSLTVMAPYTTKQGEHNDKNSTTTSDVKYGNTSLQHIYIKGTTALQAFDAKRAERETLTKAHNDAVAAQNAANTKLREEVQKQTDANSVLAALVAPPSSASDADKQAYKIQQQVAAQKVTEANAAVEKATQKVHAADAAVTSANLALSQFTATNPLPPSTTPTPRTFGMTSSDSIYETKTNTQGSNTGTIWNFAADDIKRGHQNFTEKGKLTEDKNIVKKGFVYSGRDLNGNLLVVGHDVKDLSNSTSTSPTAIAAEKVASRNLNETVAEIYGYRTKANHLSAQNGSLNGFDKPYDIVDNAVEPSDPKTPANNLPLVNEYNGAKLTNVQYGRVTTALSDKAATEQFYKEGLQLDGSIKTYVASFGEYGNKGTENHYFYRGINNVGATELTKLKEDTKNGTITYDGHAVTYGLNNNYRGNIPIPTAIGARAGFVSGNHAGVTINLANNKVAGSIYNLWYDSVNSPKDLLPVHLVKFNGTIADNGNIAGTAVREDNKTTGLFGATLYGNGAEIGGTVASDDKGANKWGGVLGGFRTDKATPAEVEYKQAVGTDGGN